MGAGRLQVGFREVGNTQINHRSDIEFITVLPIDLKLVKTSELSQTLSNETKFNLSGRIASPEWYSTEENQKIDLQICLQYSIIKVKKKVRRKSTV